jgi:hypothetical protein
MPNVSSHGAPPAVRAASLRAKASMAQSRWSVSSRRSLHRMSNQYVKQMWEVNLVIAPLKKDSKPAKILKKEM